MYHTQKEDGEQHFWQEFDLEEGEYQYKFRLGPGDWWVLDETTPIGKFILIVQRRWTDTCPS